MQNQNNAGFTLPPAVTVPPSTAISSVPGVIQTLPMPLRRPCSSSGDSSWAGVAAQSLSGSDAALAASVGTTGSGGGAGAVCSEDIGALVSLGDQEDGSSNKNKKGGRVSSSIPADAMERAKENAVKSAMQADFAVALKLNPDCSRRVPIDNDPALNEMSNAIHSAIFARKEQQLLVAAAAAASNNNNNNNSGKAATSSSSSSNNKSNKSAAAAGAGTTGVSFAAQRDDDDDDAAALDQQGKKAATTTTTTTTTTRRGPQLRPRLSNGEVAPSPTKNAADATADAAAAAARSSSSKNKSSKQKQQQQQQDDADADVVEIGAASEGAFSFVAAVSEKQGSSKAWTPGMIRAAADFFRRPENAAAGTTTTTSSSKSKSKKGGGNEHFSVRTNLTLEMLRTSFLHVFAKNTGAMGLLPVGDDDDDDDVANSPEAIAAAQLLFLAAVVERLPILAQCHAEALKQAADGGGGGGGASTTSAAEDAAAATEAGVTLAQIVDAVLSRVLTDSVVDSVISAFSTTARSVVRTWIGYLTAINSSSSSSETGGKRTASAGSTSSKAGGGIGGQIKQQLDAKEKKSKKKGAAASSSLATDLQSRFDGLLHSTSLGSGAFANLLSSGGAASSGIFSDTQVSTLLDSCVSLMTAFAQRDIVQLQTSTGSSALSTAATQMVDRWKRNAFSPCLLLSHAICAARRGAASVLPRFFLSMLPKTAPAASVGVFSVAGCAGNNSAQPVTVTLSAVSAAALVLSMPLQAPAAYAELSRELAASSSTTAAAAPAVVPHSASGSLVNSCHSFAREWADSIVDTLLSAFGIIQSQDEEDDDGQDDVVGQLVGNDNNKKKKKGAAAKSTKKKTTKKKDDIVAKDQKKDTKDERNAVLALSDRFCDDLCSVLANGVVMLPMWDCLVRDFSATLVRRVLKDSDGAVAQAGLPVAAADRLRAHAVSIVGRLAVAVGQAAALPSSASRRRGGTAATLTSAQINNNSKKSGTKKATAAAAAAAAAATAQNNSGDTSAGSGPLLDSKWLQDNTLTGSWRRMAQQQVSDEAANNIQATLGAQAAAAPGGKKPSGKGGRGRAAKRAPSTSSSDDDPLDDDATAAKKKGRKPAAAAARLASGQEDVARKHAVSAFTEAAVFPFADAADITARVQFVRYHLLSELAHIHGDHAALYFSARQYHLAKWVAREMAIAHAKAHSEDSNNNNDATSAKGKKQKQQQQQNKKSSFDHHIVPFHALLSYDPIKANVGMRVSTAADIQLSIVLLRAEEGLVSGQMPDSVLFPRNSDIFLRLVLSVFGSSSSSSAADSISASGSGWDSARKSALKIVSRMLALQPALLPTAWSLVRRSLLHSHATGIRSAVIPLLVSLLHLDTGDSSNSSSSNDGGKNKTEDERRREAAKRATATFAELEEEAQGIMAKQQQQQLDEEMNSTGMTAAMLTALVLAANDPATTVHTPAINALCDILESTSSYSPLLTAQLRAKTSSARATAAALASGESDDAAALLLATTGGSSRDRDRVLSLFQSDPTLERFTISRLLDAVLSPAASRVVASESDGGAAAQQQAAGGAEAAAAASSSSAAAAAKAESAAMIKLRVRVCRMFIARWLGPLMNVSSSSNNNTLMVESHMGGVREEWVHLATFGIEPPFENASNNGDASFRSISKEFQQQQQHKVGDDGTVSADGTSSSSKAGGDAAPAADRASIDGVHILTSVLRLGVGAVSADSGDAKRAVNDAMQRVLRFSLRRWLVEARKKQGGRKKKSADGGDDDGDEEFEEEEEECSFFGESIEPGPIFAAMHRIADACPQAVAPHYLIFLNVINNTIQQLTQPPQGGQQQQQQQLTLAADEQRAMQVIHACDVLRVSLLCGGGGGGSNTTAAIEAERVAGSVVTLLLKYSGSFAHRVIAAACRCISAVLSVGDRVGNTRHIERVYRELNRVAASVGNSARNLKTQQQQLLDQLSGGQKQQPQQQQQQHQQFARSVSVLTRYVFVLSSMLRCHSWAARDYPALRGLDCGTPENLLKNSPANISTAVSLPVVMFQIMSLVNDFASTATTIFQQQQQPSSITQLFAQHSKLRAVAIHGFGSLCMLNAAVYIRKCESVFRATIEQCSQREPSVVAQAVQALTDFLLDEEARIRSADADEKAAGPAAAGTKLEHLLQADQNSGLGPWMMQQFWPVIAPLIGGAGGGGGGTSAQLQMAALAFCRVACAQGLASPVTFLPALTFGGSFTRCFSPHDRASALDCIRTAVEHHEDAVAGQIAPSIIRCFDFVRALHVSNSSSSNSSVGQQDADMSVEALVADLAAFDATAVYSILQQRGKRRRDAFLSLIVKHITSLLHQEQWMRNRTGGIAAATTTTTPPPVAVAEEDGNRKKKKVSNSQQKSEGDDDEQEDKKKEPELTQQEALLLNPDALSPASRSRATNAVSMLSVSEDGNNSKAAATEKKPKAKAAAAKAAAPEAASSSSKQDAAAAAPAPLSEKEQKQQRDELLLSTGRGLCQLILFLGRYLFCLPLREWTELYLVLRMLEDGAQQQMEPAIGWAQQQQRDGVGVKGGERSEDPAGFAVGVARCVAAIVCVELHSALMQAYNVTRAKLEKWEMSASSGRGGAASGGGADAAGGGTSLAAAVDDSAVGGGGKLSTKAERAIHRGAASEAAQGSFDGLLQRLATEYIEVLLAPPSSLQQEEEEEAAAPVKGKKKATTATSSSKSKSSSSSNPLVPVMDRLAELLEVKAALIQTPPADRLAKRKTAAAAAAAKSNKTSSSRTGDKKKKGRGRPRRRADTSSDEDDDDDIVFETQDYSSSDSSSSDGSSSDDDDDDSSSDDGSSSSSEEEEEEANKNKKKKAPAPKGKRRARSTTPPPKTKRGGRA